MKLMWIYAAIVAMALTGCTHVTTNVHASAYGGFVGTEHTYVLTHTALQDMSPVQAQYDALLRDELTHVGFLADGGGGARYRVSVAYETRPVGVSVVNGNCAEGGGSCSDEPSFAFPGFHRYFHSLTLRFFHRPSGVEVYKVVAWCSDYDADAAHARPYLVKSVLARLPYGTPGRWRLEFLGNEVDAAPNVISFVPAER